MWANVCFNFERNGKAYWALHTPNDDPKQPQIGLKWGFMAITRPYMIILELVLCEHGEIVSR